LSETQHAAECLAIIYCKTTTIWFSIEEDLYDFVCCGNLLPNKLYLTQFNRVSQHQAFVTDSRMEKEKLKLRQSSESTNYLETAAVRHVWSALAVDTFKLSKFARMAASAGRVSVSN